MQTTKIFYIHPSQSLQLDPAFNEYKTWFKQQTMLQFVNFPQKFYFWEESPSALTLYSRNKNNFFVLPKIEAQIKINVQDEFIWDEYNN